MRLGAIAKGIYIRITAGQKYAVKIVEYRVDVFPFWNETDVDRSAAGGFDGLAIMTRKI
jgi:hypothetical protein